MPPCPSQQGGGLAVMGGGHKTTPAAPSRQEDREGDALFQVQINPRNVELRST